MHTINTLNISYDPTKDAANIAKHGVSLSVAMQLNWDTLIALQDTRRDYGECRMIGYALNGMRLFCVVFVERGDTRRIISQRKANNREMRDYAVACDH